MCLFQSLPHSGDDIGELDLSIASDSTPVSPVTTPGTEVRCRDLANKRKNYIISTCDM